MTANSATVSEAASMLDRGLRSSGMRDLGPDELAGLREVERRFLEVTAARGYREIRTPALEPLHLYSASGALSPQLLDRVYSFLDWDGWSGERVVLRPDSTVPAARWYSEHVRGGVARLSYVQPVYRFAPEGGDREQWQCGVELFGLAAHEADSELLLLARDVVLALGLGEPSFDLAHAGLVRSALAAAGLDAAQQVEAYDELLSSEAEAVERLLINFPQGSSALRLLFGVEGDAAGYLANLRATLVRAVPEADTAVAELEAVAAALDAAGCSYRVRPASVRNFEYYTGVTFVARIGGAECLAGGRYDGLVEAVGGEAAPGSGFGADLLRLASLRSGGGR